MKIKSTQKTIWYISKYFDSPICNSIGSRGWHLVKEFAKKGHQGLVITSDSNHLTEFPKLTNQISFFDVDQVKIVVLKTINYQYPNSFRRMLSWLHFEWNLFWLNKKQFQKPDVVIISSLSLLTILNGYLIKKKYKAKLIFEVRDIWPLTLKADAGYSQYNPFILFLQFVEKFGYRCSDLIVGTMPNLSEHVSNVLGFEKRVECIPMGVNIPPDSDKPMEADPEYIKRYLNPKYFNLVYAGTIGLTNALEIFFLAAECLKERPQLRFVVIGDGNLKAEYIKKYAHLPNLIFAPKVNKEQVHSLLVRADLLYFSGHQSEVFKYGQSLNKLIDYMYSGRPILASYSGYQSMINESGCGFFVPAEDVKALVNQIIELTNLTEKELSEIGQRGKNWLVKNRNYEKLAADYLSLMFEDGQTAV